MRAGNKIAGRMTRDYLLALGVIALLAFSAYSATDRVVARQQVNAEIVALSAGQTMLSQRIALSAITLASAEDATDAAAARATLAAARDAFRAAHERLAPAAAEAGGDLAQIYHGPYHRLDEQAHALVALVDRLIAEAPGEIQRTDAALVAATADERLLAALQGAAALHRLEAEADIEGLRTLQGVIAALTVAVLALLAAAIFAPMVRRVSATTEALVQAKQAMEHNALHDPLTGLPNRRYLNEYLSHTLANARRYGHVVGMLHLDLDRFKLVNDTLGHAAGDAVLIAAAKVMQAGVRKSDFLARIGGDEFVIVSPETPKIDGLGILAERLIEAIARPIPYERTTCQIGVSIGIALARPEYGLDPERLLMNADAALYDAKHSGRGCFRFHPGDEPAPAAAPAPALTVVNARMS